ncbi:MAG: S8 family serine peptidase [Proteobacteria bacterium]|nr:S8 family serine peptidase [Pseudomonadota bacterium]
MTVAVLDSGINLDNSEFIGRIADPGYDFVTDTPGVTQDLVGHGTFVSGIIAADRNGYGVEGVAYDAQLIPERIVNPDGSITLSDAQIAAAIRYGTAHGAKVQNNSWNSSVPITRYAKSTISAYLANTLQAYREAIQAGAIIVFAAGNSSMNQPGLYAELPLYYSELLPGFLAAVATDATGKIASYSNRCGAAAAWCLAAPGSNIISTLGTGYGTGSGTSFAAPMVSAAAAILDQEWPFLTNAQIKNILLTTANKSGIYAKSNTYGQGLLDLEKATRPVGTVTVSTGSSVASSSGKLSNSLASFTGAFGKVSSASTPQTMVLDAYGRDYDVSTAAMFQNVSHRFDADQALESFDDRLTQFSDGRTVLAFALTPGGHSILPGAGFNGARLFMEAPMESMTLTGAANLDPSVIFGLAPREVLFRAEAVEPEVASNAYLSLVRNATTLALKVPVHEGVWLRGGSFFGVEDNDPAKASTLADDPRGVGARAAIYGGVGEIGVDLGRQSAVAVSAGFIEENGTLLGASSSGVAALADHTLTSFVSGSAKADLGDGFMAFAGAEFGWSRAQTPSNSLVTDISALTSQAMRVGFTKTSVLSDKDSFGFILSQPLQVRGGSAGLSIPTARDFDGHISRTRATLDFASQGQAFDMQAFYQMALDEKGSLAAGLLLRQNADNASGSDHETVALARYRLSF